MSNLDRLRKMAEYAFGRVLDVGCTQYPNPYLRNVVGFDLVERKKLPENYIGFIQGDAEDLGTHLSEGSFDCVVAGEVIEHLENPFKFFRGCYKILRRNGFLILSTPTPYYWKTIIGDLLFQKGKKSSPEHKHVFVPRLLNTIMDSLGFKLIAIDRGLPFITWQLIYVYKF